MNSNKITEGLREGDLAELIMPLVSIDEFESKIGDDNDIIVVGFYAANDGPANDLSRFLDRTTQDIYDTDISPAPTEAGYFMVFVEIPRNEKFPKCLMSLLEEIDQLVENDDWKFKVFSDDTIYDASEENFAQHVNLDNVEVSENFEIRKFLNLAYLDKVSFSDKTLMVEAKGTTHKFNIVSYGTENLDETLSHEFDDISKSSAVSTLFGPGYSCYLTASQKFVITNDNSVSLTLTKA